MTIFRTPRPPKVQHTQGAICQVRTKLARAVRAILAVGELYQMHRVCHNGEGRGS